MMDTRRTCRLAPVVLAVAAAPLLTDLAACAFRGATSSPAAQMAFGAEMARRSYWREAKFRWEKALVARPNDPHLLSNLAVAAESLGDFSAALASYKRALELAPADRKIQENYTRFAEFYSNYVRGTVETTPDIRKKQQDLMKPPRRPF